MNPDQRATLGRLLAEALAARAEVDRAHDRLLDLRAASDRKDAEVLRAWDAAGIPAGTGVVAHGHSWQVLVVPGGGATLIARPSDVLDLSDDPTAEGPR